MRTFGGKTIYRADDGGHVTSGLMMLHDAGYPLAPNELFAAALQAGWVGREAVLLRETASEIAGGKRKKPRAKYPPAP